MANQHVNKVEYGNDTLIDLTEDSVTANTLLPNTTAHDRSGAQITGSASASVLPAVDTDNILGGGAGASTNTQAMLDGLADGLGDVKSDLSDLDDEKLDITDEQVLGAWNLLTSFAQTEEITSGGNSLTITANPDGSVTINGDCATSVYYKVCSVAESYDLPKELLYLSGTHYGDGVDKCRVYAKRRNADNTEYEQTYNDMGSGVLIDIPSGRKWEVFIAIIASNTFNNYTLYPMLTVKPYYTPYVQRALTNRELTDAPNWNSANNIANNTDLNNLKDGKRHFCQNGSIASTLTHCPVSVAFVLDVICINDSNTAYLQILQPIDGDKIFKRNCINNVFSSWYKFTGTAV